MNHLAILDRSVKETLGHKSLWILGFIWAFVGGCGGAGFGQGFQWTADEPLGDVFPGLGVTEGQLEAALPGLIGLILVLVLVLLVVAVVAAVVRYVLQAGIYRSLDMLYVAQVAPGVRSTFRAGWHRRTWRLLGQNLLVGIPLAALAFFSLLLIALPTIMALVAFDEPAVAVVPALGLFCVWVLVAMVVSIVVGALKELWWRAAVVDDEGFIEAMGTGFRLARANVGDIVATWLLLVVAGLIWAIVVGVTLIVSLGVAAVIAGVPAYLLVQGGYVIWAALWGLPVMGLVVGLPMMTLSGLWLVFHASVWGQVYRALVDGAPTPAEAVVVSGLPKASATG